MSSQDIRAGDVIRNRQHHTYRNTVDSTYIDENGQNCVRYVDGGWDFVSGVEIILPARSPALKPTYKLIEHSNADALCALVNAAILKGFMPIGGVSMTSHNYYAQAMLKE